MNQKIDFFKPIREEKEISLTHRGMKLRKMRQQVMGGIGICKIT